MPLNPRTGEGTGVVGAKTITPPEGMFSKIYQKHIRKATERVMIEEEGIVKRAFERTTRTWARRPRFETRRENMAFTGKEQAGRARVMIWTENEVYGYINFGTKPRIIRPKNGRFLVFPRAFRSKTHVRVIGSQQGYTGKVPVFAVEVRHPGIKARSFDDEIVKRRRPWFKKKMDERIALATKRANREIEKLTKRETPA